MQAPQEHVTDGTGGVLFPLRGGFGQQRRRGVAGALCVGEGGCQGLPARFGQDLIGQLHRLTQVGGLRLMQGLPQTPPPLVQQPREAGSGPIGSAQVLGDLPVGGCLLSVPFSSRASGRR
ncbi:hypothetical protein [Streptomyces coeruleorubidus]|uniref:hypothetical protein n=1 Tax=Streptomyces coeruleorubidus TaxID=116188 RepID=UPI0018748B5C|nr:hypothetical protein GCM10010244_37540 [Streptomyces bellus]